MFTYQIHTKRKSLIRRSILRSIVKNLKFMVCFYEIQTNMSISEILLKNTEIVEKDHQFSFNSYVRRYNAYLDVWAPNVVFRI